MYHSKQVLARRSSFSRKIDCHGFEQRLSRYSTVLLCESSDLELTQQDGEAVLEQERVGSLDPEQDAEGNIG